MKENSLRLPPPKRDLNGSHPTSLPLLGRGGRLSTAVSLPSPPQRHLVTSSIIPTSNFLPRSFGHDFLKTESSLVLRPSKRVIEPSPARLEVVIVRQDVSLPSLLRGATLFSLPTNPTTFCPLSMCPELRCSGECAGDDLTFAESSNPSTVARWVMRPGRAEKGGADGWAAPGPASRLTLTKECVCVWKHSYVGSGPPGQSVVAEAVAAAAQQVFSSSSSVEVSSPLCGRRAHEGCHGWEVGQSPLVLAEQACEWKKVSYCGSRLSNGQEPAS